MTVRGPFRSGRPLGAPQWIEQMAERLNVELIPRPRGRPRKESQTGYHLPLTQFALHWHHLPSRWSGPPVVAG
jgi:hypothetical protein